MMTTIVAAASSILQQQTPDILYRDRVQLLSVASSKEQRSELSAAELR